MLDDHVPLFAEKLKMSDSAIGGFVHQLRLLVVGDNVNASEEGVMSYGVHTGYVLKATVLIT